MWQTWEHLLFAHWPVPCDLLRPLIPAEIEVDTFDGQAWISIIPFLLTGVRIRFTPRIPFTHTFPEINVRTYVKAGGKSGIYFLSLDAANPLMTTIAKKWYRLPYHPATMQFRHRGEEIDVQSRRWRSPLATGRFSAVYRPDSAMFMPRPGSLEHWLTERYTLFCQCARSKKIYGADVYHEPWKLQKAAVTFRENTMTHNFFSLAGYPPLCLYARGVQSIIWPIREAQKRGGTN
ncbi:YqjF family protein [Brevibacillus sp. GCM10020057]|uniref:YqjF family protein n=1 Tax=Brevibacillus sp. GCM10020057 TaxID=3317327 RepID=UPI00363A016A